MNKAEWLDSLMERRRARGYTEAELAEIRRDQEARLAGITDEEFAAAYAARTREDPR